MRGLEVTIRGAEARAGLAPQPSRSSAAAQAEGFRTSRSSALSYPKHPCPPFIIAPFHTSLRMEAQNRNSKQDKVKSSFIEDWAGLTSQVRVKGAWATSSFDIVALLTPYFKHQVFVRYGGIYPEIQWGSWSD